MVDYRHPCDPDTLGSRWHDPKRAALHVGDDYKVRYGTPVKAIADGEVIACPQHRLWGFYVWIEHADGKVSSYHQLQRGGRPAVGARVRQGQVVGLVGRPLNYLTEAQREADPTWAGQVKRDSAGNYVSKGELGHFHLGTLASVTGGWINPATVIKTTAVAALGTAPLEPEDDMPYTEDQLRGFAFSGALEALSKWVFHMWGAGAPNNLQGNIEVVNGHARNLVGLATEDAKRREEINARAEQRHAELVATQKAHTAVLQQAASGGLDTAALERLAADVAARVVADADIATPEEIAEATATATLSKLERARLAELEAEVTRLRTDS